MDLKYFEHQFDMVDDRLAAVREQVDIYTRSVKDLDAIHIDILAYVASSNDKLAFLDQLSNGLLTRLQTTSAQLITEKEKVRVLTEEVADLKARLADAESRLHEVLMKETTDLAPQLAAAIRAKELAEQQLRQNQEQQQRSYFGDLGARNDQDALQRLAAMVTSRTTDQMTSISELESQLYTANKRLEAVTAQMQETKALGARLQNERDAQAEALKAREELVSEAIRRSQQLSTDQADYNTLYTATNRVSEIPEVVSGTGTNSPPPSLRRRVIPEPGSTNQ